MDKAYYILIKNGEVIAQTDAWKEMRSIIPDSHAEHKGDVYDYFCILDEGDNVRISSGKNVYNSFCVRYEELNGGEYERVTISKKDLALLLEKIGGITSLFS